MSNVDLVVIFPFTYIFSQGLSTTVVLVCVEMGISYDHNTSRSANSANSGRPIQLTPFTTELLKEVMYRLMVEGNAKRKNNGEEPLSSLLKLCDYFDLIGGSSTGGCAALYYYNYINDTIYNTG
jgi:hypothetical protein